MSFVVDQLSKILCDDVAKYCIMPYLTISKEQVIKNMIRCRSELFILYFIDQRDSLRLNSNTNLYRLDNNGSSRIMSRAEVSCFYEKIEKRIYSRIIKTHNFH